MDGGVFRYERSCVILSSSTVSSDQRQNPAGEAGTIEDPALETGGLFLGPHVLLVREDISGVQALHEEAEKGMKGRSQRSVQVYQVGEEAAASLLVVRAEQMCDERPGVAAGVEGSAAVRQNGLQCPVSVAGRPEVWGSPHVGLGCQLFQ